MIMCCTTCQFVPFAKLIPETVGFFQSKTVLEILILVVANNIAFDVWYNHHTFLSHQLSSLEQGER